MKIQEVIEKYGLRPARDKSGELIIPGAKTAGKSHIYQHSSKLLGLTIIPKRTNAKFWNSVKRKCEAAGMKIIQDGDCEGTALFDPSNALQRRTAFKAISVRRKRVASESQLAVLAKNWKKPEAA